MRERRRENEKKRFFEVAFMIFPLLMDPINN
jgi:hypothetical protein